MQIAARIPLFRDPADLDRMKLNFVKVAPEELPQPPTPEQQAEAAKWSILSHFGIRPEPPK